MRNRCLLTIAVAVLSLAGRSPGACSESKVLEPMQVRNLSIYPIRGQSAGEPRLLMLDQALRQGRARVYSIGDQTLALSNFLDQAIFVPGGTLLKGGPQDQVVVRDLIVPPGASDVELATYCIDPFRSGPREGDNAVNYSTDGSMFPWRMARLNLVSGIGKKGETTVRQAGVWWSIDTLRSQLSARLGEPLEPALTPKWEPRLERSLNGRRSPWKTGLILALDNRKLAQALVPYRRIATDNRIDNGDIVGAVFAINGRIDGIELYRTHALFQAMWPTLLRAYSIEALAVDDGTVAKPPLAANIDEVIKSASGVDAGQESMFDIRQVGGMISSGLYDDRGRQIHRSILPLPDDGAVNESPENLTLQALWTGEIAGQSLMQLSHFELSFMPDGAGSRWHAEITTAVGRDVDASSPSREGWEFIRYMRSRERVTPDRAEIGMHFPDAVYESIQPKVTDRILTEASASGTVGPVGITASAAEPPAPRADFGRVLAAAAASLLLSLLGIGIVIVRQIWRATWIRLRAAQIRWEAAFAPVDHGVMMRPWLAARQLWRGSGLVENGVHLVRLVCSRRVVTGAV